MKKIIFFCLVFLFLSSSLFSEEKNLLDQGVWVSIFSPQKALYSKAAAVELTDFCTQNKINQIYLQVYQSGNAYFNSQLSSREKYDEILKLAGLDIIDFLLKEAHAKQIKVFAWINILSLGNNKDAYIIKQYGQSVLTRDQYLKTSGPIEHEKDEYYLRDKHYFLEPGDSRVKNYYISLVKELLERYPEFDGVHLDYVRYPMTVPFIPGARFKEFGLDYGYGEKNLSAFKEKENLNPLTELKEAEKITLWDNWKRRQVTELVESISKVVRELALDKKVSCAVVPDYERAYSSMSQDWPLWLEKKIVDYVVLMNYAQDPQLFKESVKAGLSFRSDSAKVYIGIAAFLLKDKPLVFFDEYKSTLELKADGVVFFSYDDLSSQLASYLRS